jgi:type IV secretion system protein VirD4
VITIDIVNEIMNNKFSYFNNGAGIVLGMNKKKEKEVIYTIGNDTHSICIGSTRSGKSRSVVLQSICSLGLAGESMILSDPKGELYNYTYPFLKRLGYEVVCIDFKNPLKSDSYNFLQPTIDAVNKNDIAEATECAWDITSALVGEAKGEKLWNNGEASTIAGSIMNVVYDNRGEFNRKYQNMTNTYFFIANMYKTISQDGRMPIVDYMKNFDDNHPSRGLIAISEIAPSRTRGSFFTAALATLRLFTSPRIYSMTNKTDFDPKDLGRKKMALFIILPDAKSTYYSIASLLVSQIYEQLDKVADERGGRLKNRVNYILDEFGNFTKIPDFANKVTMGGGKGIRFNLFLQSFAQLDEKYGKEQSKIIRGNCDTWIYLKSNDTDTLEEISKRLDTYTISTYSLSSQTSRNSAGSSGQSKNLTGRRLLFPGEVKQIERPYSLVLSDGNPAIMYAPDLSEYSFNKMLGLGDKEHNRMVREIREGRRKVKKIGGDIDLWNVWELFG